MRIDCCILRHVNAHQAQPSVSGPRNEKNGHEQGKPC